MKTIKNKKYDIVFEQLFQDPNTNKITTLMTAKEMSFAELIIAELKKAPEGGFPDISILKMRLDAISALNGAEDKTLINVENAVFDTIMLAGNSFRPALVSQALLDFKNDVTKMLEDSKKKEVATVEKGKNK